MYTLGESPNLEREGSALAEPSETSVNVVCVASYFKGADFLRECAGQGARVELLTRERTRHEPWPRESLGGLHFLPDEAGGELVVHAAAHLCRERRVDALVALEEFDVITAALAREHLRLPGMDSSRARVFRDKLAMRVSARDAGLRVPEFVPLFNYQEVGEYMERVLPPWVVKPRSDVSSSGIRRLEEAEQVWRAIEALDAREALQDKSSYYLLEKFVPGEVFHVDSVVEDGEVIFAGASRYGRPPLRRRAARAASSPRTPSSTTRPSTESFCGSTPSCSARSVSGAGRRTPSSSAARRTANSTSSKWPRASAARTSRRRWRPRAATTSGASGRASRWRTRAANESGALSRVANTRGSRSRSRGRSAPTPPRTMTRR